MPKPFRIALIVSPAAAFAVFAAVFLIPRWNDRPPATEPTANGASGRLVVVAVFDQMRGDYPQRWADLLDDEGFKRMERDGVCYANARLPYSCSATGPGHASIGTGLPPSTHGIVENEWFDRSRGGLVRCMTSERPSTRVPAAIDGSNAGFSPELLLADGLGDRLKAARSDSRVFSLALKDRAGAMMGGKRPDAVYAFDTATGEFHTTSYYRDTPHPWATEFSRKEPADAWFTKRWERLLSAEKYEVAGSDDAEGETEYAKDPFGGLSGYGRTFPHPMNIDGQKTPGGRYYSRLETSPFGNDLLWQFAEACITGEKLGRGGRTDLLFVGFSATDLIGHAWGPDSHEVLDTSLRCDRLVKAMQASLDERVGPGLWTLIVTADHGICPLPERWAKERPDAERFDPRLELNPDVMGELLNEKFGGIGPDPRAWFAEGGRSYYPNLYLNHAAIRAHGVKVDDVATALAKWAANRPHVEAAFTRAQLTGKPATDPLTRRCQLGYHPDRCGDVSCVTKPYCLPTGTFSLGTSHGSPHEYDRHVVLFAAGAGVPKLGRRDEEVSSLVLGPIICKLLGIDPPAELPEKLPPGW